MSFSIDASELNALAADLSNVAGKIGPKVQTVMRKTARDIEADAKAFAPVDTGNLRSSIGHSDLRTVGQSGTLEVEIGPTANYGVFVEFGTSRMAPHAFMGPAFDRRSPGFVSALEDIVGEFL
ncbi:HK97-gp10 family putative phage morphogenesis protein [Oerskovia jenensis]|uniref:HK97 gp10 family phage protein n=1 Tax=Oerskovia jenensis TaxID=162169 RepID=A0ABS2LJ35_9CELL|nr:HK97-gp10 family putative phage morphogenesis protein [Oerskovia jenensis]MBM7480123.1 HK97 gp10 family phage protein [Oerskovia jenensis]